MGNLWENLWIDDGELPLNASDFFGAFVCQVGLYVVYHGFVVDMSMVYMLRKPTWSNLWGAPHPKPLGPFK